MMPSPTMMIPETMPASLLGPAVETGLVAMGLIVLAVLVGLCVHLLRRGDAVESRRASLHPFAPRAGRAVRQARAA